MRGIANLTPYEAAVTGSTFGLWGQATKDVDEIAEALGGGWEEVADAIKSSKAKIRRHLVECGHVFTAEEQYV
jgi:hypothetical protein